MARSADGGSKGSGADREAVAGNTGTEPPVGVGQAPQKAERFCMPESEFCLRFCKSQMALRILMNQPLRAVKCLSWVQGVARNLLRRKNQGVWGTEVSSGVQRRKMETLENTNGAVTKIDLRLRMDTHPCPPGYAPDWVEIIMWFSMRFTP